MATENQRIYNDDYKISIYKGDTKTIDVGVYQDFYKQEGMVITGYTCYLKTDLFTITGITYDLYFVEFNFTEEETDNTPGLYNYEIYIVKDGKKETLIQHNFEIINVI